MAVLFFAARLATAQDPPDVQPEIPQAEISRLEEQFSALKGIESTIELRRATKRIVRGAEALIEEYADTLERFRVLGIVFQAQKLMFTMRQSDEYRDALMETAGKLLEAPDEYADVRVEPDMMLLQVELQRRGATPGDGALEVARFADRYRDTAAEAQSLMMAATLAFEQGHVVLLNAFRNTLTERFADDPMVTAFMRERFASGADIHLAGEFKRADGERMSFPLGRIYVVCFWSLDTPMLKEKVAEVKNLQVRYKGQFDVYSFNLDELPDSGASALGRMELDWIPMRLPGGAANPVYLSVGGANLFSALVVSAHGLASKGATGRSSASLQRTYEALAGSPRRAALLRSLAIGDYLVTDTPASQDSGIPVETLDAIRGCFPMPPMRYRLSPENERAVYREADALCAEAVVKHAGAEDLWRVHNSRTVALLGLWRQSGELDYLSSAVASARAALAQDLPRSARVVPHFCLATKTLVEGGSDVDAVELLDRFVEAAGGDQAPGSAYAAAMMLALEAHSRDAYRQYRNVLLNDFADDPSAFRVLSFLLDPSCADALFGGALPGDGTGETPSNAARRRFEAEWTSVNGKPLHFTGGTNSHVTAVVFMEPTTDRNQLALRKRVVDHLVETRKNRPLKDLAIVGAFRGADTNAVLSVMNANRWSFPAVGLTDLEWQRCSSDYGVFSSDFRPNVYLLRGDDSIMMALSGVSMDTERPDTLNMRIDMALRQHSLDLAEKALEAGNYAEYAARLATSFPLANRRRDRHEPAQAAPSMHGRRLTWAYMQAEQWDPALGSASRNIALLKGDANPRDRTPWCRVCHGYLRDMFVRIVLLRKMGADQEAEKSLALTDFPTCSHGKSVDALWQDVESYVQTRPQSPRFSYLGDPKRFLDEHEYNMRASRQSLYHFGIESDLMQRAIIHEKLGDAAAAKRDRQEAAVRSWPFKPREYDPALLHEACVARRREAREHLEAGRWQQALALADRNIDIHEREPRRCNSMCKICWAQVQSFGYRAATLEGLGRQQEAESSRKMADLCKCPPGEDLESYKCFPINRMYGGGSGVNRLNFIERVMDGSNSYAFSGWTHRQEMAGDLVLRAEALTHLGQTKEAGRDRTRATALAFPVGARTFAFSEVGREAPARYEDLLNVENPNP